MNVIRKGELEFRSVAYYKAQIEKETENHLQAAVFIGSTMAAVNASSIDDSEKIEALKNLIEAWKIVRNEWDT